MAYVEFRDVRKVYQMGSVEVHAVDGMDFEINEGELCVIVGPSWRRQDDRAQHAWRHGLLHERHHHARRSRGERPLRA